MSLLFVCLPARASPGCSRNNSQPCFSAYLRRLLFLRRRAFFLFLIWISILFRFCFFVYVFVYFPSPRAFPPAHTASQDFPVERLLASGAESTTALAIFRLCKQQSLDHRMSMLWCQRMCVFTKQDTPTVSISWLNLLPTSRRRYKYKKCCILSSAGGKGASTRI